MKITNNANLPAPIVRAVQADTYSKGEADYSISELLRPPQINHLTQIHADELTEDASDMIWRLLGNSIHEILGAGLTGRVDEMGEVRLYEQINGVTISGKFDHILVSDGVLTDYKVTSAWSVMHGVKPEWEKQLNYYKSLAEENDIIINQLQVVAILRDWSRSQMLRSDDYPRSSVEVVPVSMYDPVKVRREMIIDINDQNDARAGNPRPCTNEERWYRPGKVALMKEGRKSAVKLFDTGKETIEYIMQSKIQLRTVEKTAAIKKGEYYIEERPGSYPRCENYCAVSEFCDQWKETET